MESECEEGYFVGYPIYKMNLLESEMRSTNFAKIVLMAAAILALAVTSSGAGKQLTVKGYVIDSACAFTKGLKKPISGDCATACAKAGSPLVILTDKGTIYWPIADTTPSTSQNDKLLPYAGQRVNVTGKTFQRGGSIAMVIDKIEPITASK